MKKLLLFAVLALPAFPQFFGGSNASKIRGINVLGPLTVSDGCALVYVAASTRFECGAGSGGGTGNGIVAVTVSAATSATLTHNAVLATPYIVPFVCREDTTNLPVIPATTAFSTNAIDFTFSPAFTGKCAASTGGSGISGTISTSQICYGSASNTCAGSAGLTFTDAASVRLLTLAGGSSQSTNPLLDITNSAGSSHWLTVLGDGKVGIGTNAPANALDVVTTSGIAVGPANGSARTTIDAIGTSRIYMKNAAGTIVNFLSGGGVNYIGGGSVGIGTSNTTPVGTLEAYDAGASGITRSWIREGAGQTTSESFGVYANDGTTPRIAVANNVFTITSGLKLAMTNSTGAGTALLGTNSPAVTLSAPYTWVTVTTSDGSTGYIPIWK